MFISISFFLLLIQGCSHIDRPVIVEESKKVPLSKGLHFNPFRDPLADVYIRNGIKVEEEWWMAWDTSSTFTKNFSVLKEIDENGVILRENGWHYTYDSLGFYSRAIGKGDLYVEKLYDTDYLFEQNQIIQHITYLLSYTHRVKDTVNHPVRKLFFDSENRLLLREERWNNDEKLPHYVTNYTYADEKLSQSDNFRWNEVTGQYVPNTKHQYKYEAGEVSAVISYYNRSYGAQERRLFANKETGLLDSGFYLFIEDGDTAIHQIRREYRYHNE